MELKGASPETRPVALITGGSSGIGAAFGRRLARNGYDLILVARREGLLRNLCKELSEKHGISAEYLIADLSNPLELQRVEEHLKGISNLEMLINNAGYGRHILFHEDDIDVQEAMLRVHVTASVRLAHAAIPVMLSRGKGAIINVSSGAGLRPRPRSLMYHATKAFLNNFSESLHLELRNMGIRVQALCPGLTRTDFHMLEDFHMKLDCGDAHPIFKKKKSMSPEEVVKISLKCLKKNKVICNAGLRNKMRRLLIRHMPRRMLYWLDGKRLKSDGNER
jgi:short-subunit dehydrogenase